MQVVCLDGENGEEALPSYIAGIDSILDWCYANGIVKDVSHIYGPGAVVFTTPPNGSFHMELESSGRSLEVIINGSDLYVMGWRGPNGSFEIKSDTQTVNYMIGTDVSTVNVSRNYSVISPRGDVRYTRVGIYELRRAFDALYNYRGGSPGTIEEAYGIIAVHLSEATRLQGAFDTVCASLTFDEVSRLHKWTLDPLWVNRYGHYCQQEMIQIDYRMSGMVPPPIKIRGIQVNSAEDIRKEIRVLHIDAYKRGIFAHDPKLHSKPEVCFEEPSDASPSQGVGTSNIKGSMGKEFNKTGKHKKRRMKGIETGEKKVAAHSYACGCPPSRRYKASPDIVSSSPPPQLDHNWQEYVQRDSRVRNFLLSSRGGASALNQIGAPLSDSNRKSQLSALRKLCKCNYDMRKQRETPPSLQSSVNTIAREYRAQPSRRTFAKLQCKVSQRKILWSLLQRSSLPLARLSTVNLKKRRALVLMTSEQLRTVSVTREVEYRLVPRKAPILQAGAFLSRLLRVLRR